MPEKRSDERRRKRLKVRFGVDGPHRTAFARDLSTRGMQIQTNRVLMPGTTIQVELSFPDRTFTMWARVAWAKKVPHQLAHSAHCGMGVEFLEPEAEWSEYLDKLG